MLDPVAWISRWEPFPNSQGQVSLAENGIFRVYDQKAVEVLLGPITVRGVQKISLKSNDRTRKISQSLTQSNLPNQVINFY